MIIWLTLGTSITNEWSYVDLHRVRGDQGINNPSKHCRWNFSNNLRACMQLFLGYTPCGPLEDSCLIFQSVNSLHTEGKSTFTYTVEPQLYFGPLVYICFYIIGPGLLCSNFCLLCFWEVLQKLAHYAQYYVHESYRNMPLITGIKLIVYF